MARSDSLIYLDFRKLEFSSYALRWYY